MVGGERCSREGVPWLWDALVGREGLCRVWPWGSNKVGGVAGGRGSGEGVGRRRGKGGEIGRWDTLSCFAHTGGAWHGLGLFVSD